MALRLSFLSGVLSVAALAMTALAPVAAGDEDTMTPAVAPATDRPCTARERATDLVADEQRVLTRLGHLRTLTGPQDVAQLAALGAWGPDSHGWVQYHQVGVGLLDLPNSMRIIAQNLTGVTAGSVKRDTVTSGSPTGLFYESLNPAANHGDPYNPAFPYMLVGWFYGGVYTPGITPITNGLCMYPTDWGFHERGVHAFPNFDMVMQPPAEQWMGQSPGSIPVAVPNPLGLVHPRAWDLHIWLVPGSNTPVTGALDTAQPVLGIDGGIPESFPYPQGPTAVGPNLPEYHGR